MAGPMAGVQQAQQIAQQQQMQKPEAAPKTGQSKFDQTMANKADQVQQTNQLNQVQQTQATNAAQKTSHVDAVQKAGKPTEVDKARAVKHNDPVDKKQAAEKPRQAIETVLTEMEGRNAAMDKFVNQAMSGKIKLNQQQLLGLQAKVAQYSLELDLTGKVVEKATNGLKDTLRTQV
ncbi:MAG: ATP-dependent helicase HrpB [Myxococcales bacterium]